jgi:hypothetical protein
MLMEGMTLHAEQRCKKRGISQELIDVALLYGQELRERGALIYRLRACDIERAFGRKSPYMHYAGLEVVVSNEGDVVITGYWKHNDAKKANKPAKDAVKRRSRNAYYQDIA